MSKIKNLGSIELILGMWVSVEIDGGRDLERGFGFRARSKRDCDGIGWAVSDQNQVEIF